MRLSALLLSVLPAFGTLPAPEAHFGHTLGEQRKLVQWLDVVAYFRSLEAASPSLRVTELGHTTESRPLIAVTIADPETIADLERYRHILAQLADPRATSPEVAEELVAEGKPVVLITCSIHSTEVASTLTAMQFAYELLSKDTPRHRAILQDTILLLVPSLNPDGVDKVHAWYERWLDTPYEGAPMTELYHKYVGHDNNRDWYIFTQKETRLIVEKVHNAWRPQVVYDVHQMGPNGARIFVPPWIDPIDPNIDPLIVQQVNAFGTAIAVDLTAAGKRGVLIHGIYDYFSPARHYQSYHGGLRLLSESASARLASPITVPAEQLIQLGRNYNATESSWNFLEPWEGGEWSLADILDNQLITFESVLYSAALRRQDLLRNFYRIGQRVTERGMGRGFVIPHEQHDPNAATRLLQTLQFGQVEIERALESSQLEEESIQAGDFVVRLAQPYGSFAKTLMERQEYPDLRVYPEGPPQPPYDVTAHTLPLLMGVRTFAVEGEIAVPTEPVREVGPALGRVDEADHLTLSPRFSSSWIAVNRLLDQDVPVHRSLADGTFHLQTDAALRGQLQEWASNMGIEFLAAEGSAAEHPPLARARVALYAGHVPIMDEGWTRWLLDRFEFPYESVGNDEVVAGLTGQHDVVILPDVRSEILDKGFRHEYGDGESIVPPEYRTALGKRGAAELRAFVDAGGTILAFNRSALYALDRLGLPIENSVGLLSKRRFYAPGALLNVGVDPTHPLCFGMRREEAVWFESGPAFWVRRQAASKARVVLRYPQREVLASGWLLGEGYLATRGAVVDVSVGSGRVILFGIRPQYRGQSNATFKMVFNSLYL